MERLLVDETSSINTLSSRVALRPKVSKTGVVLSGSSLEFIVKSIAIFHFVLVLLLLLGNLMFLFLLVSYPLHEFSMIQIAVQKEDPAHNVFHLASLTKKQFVWMLTLTSLYFIMELMIAKVLYFGAHKRSRSKCQLWVDVHQLVLLVLVMSLFYNMFDMDDSTAAILVYVLWPVSFFLAIGIYIVNSFIRDVTNNQDFSYAAFLTQKA